METGKVVSLVGNEIVVKVELPEREGGKGIFGLKAVKNMMGRRAYCGRDNIGTLYDIIGQIDRPYFIVKGNKDITPQIIGKTVKIGGFKKV